MNRDKPFENHIYSIAIPDRNYGERQVEEERERGREGIAWFIPNSPPLPNDNDNYRRYRRGLERQQEIEMILVDHQWEARSRRGQSRARVVPQARANERGRVRIRIRNLEEPAHEAAINGIGFPRWSLFQVWNNLAYVTCSVPFRIAWEDQGGRCVIKYSRVQQVICGVQQILATVEMISWWRRFANVLSDDTNPLMYVQFGSQLLIVTKRLCYMKTTIFGIQDLLQVHTYAVSAGAALTTYQIRMSKIITITAFFGYSMYLCGYSAMDFVLYTFRDYGNWDWGLAELIQTFACYARTVFIWGTQVDCPDDIFVSFEMLPRREVIYGCLGILTYASATLTKIHTTRPLVTNFPAWIEK